MEMPTPTAREQFRNGKGSQGLPPNVSCCNHAVIPRQHMVTLKVWNCSTVIGREARNLFAPEQLTWHASTLVGEGSPHGEMLRQASPPAEGQPQTENGHP